MSPTVDETMDMQAYFVRDVPQVKILNDFAENMQARPNDSVHVHDLRRQTINQQFAEEIEICRRKVNNPKSPVVGFAEEAVCFTPKGYFELKTARADETFLNVSAGSDRMAEALDPNRRNVHVKWEALRNPRRVEGRNLVFLGVGKPSNYYHWIGEQMPRLALLRKHVDLATLDHIVVFVRTPVPFIETSLRTLFPEFTGKVEQVQDHSALSDEAFFFVPNSLARRSADPERDGERLRGMMGTWGSILDFCGYVDDEADRLFDRTRDWPEIVIVSRDRAEMRHWINESDLVARLADHGAVRLCAEDHPFEDQINYFRHARVVIAQHGAGLANTIFCTPGARVIEVTSRSHAKRAWDFAKLGIARGVDYHIAVIDAIDDDPWVEVERPEPPLLTCYPSDLRASDEAIEALARLAREGS